MRRILLFPVIGGALAGIWGAGEPRSTFADVAPEAGVRAVLRNAATPEKHLIETMPGGAAVLDYNGDGRLDLFLTNGAAQPSLRKSDPGYCNVLYENKRDFSFTEVTQAAGVCGEGFSMGVAAADFDNDGDTDLFVAGVNRNQLLRNNGTGRFDDVTRHAGLTGVDPYGRKPWSVAAGWFDYDGNGHLDLLVVNYVRWDPKAEQFCGDPDRRYRTYCHPQYYEGQPNQLFRNNGDGTFSDVSASSGIGKVQGKGMAVAFADYDDDGDPDAFVTNDAVPNFLFRNEGGGRFAQVAMAAGVALNDDGRALSSMGADFRDLNNDGRPDLFFTALANETFPLFRNLGRGLFADVTYPSRVGAATLALSGWGAAIADLDNDGWKDVLTANGDVQDNTELFSDRHSRQENLLLLNQRNDTYSAHSLAGKARHRGLALGDLDGDGRLDAVITRLNEPPRVLRNRIPVSGHWLRLRLRGRRSNRDGLGARVRIRTGAREQWNHATTSVGYASSSEPLVHFGLGEADRVSLVEIRWPSGIPQMLENVKADQVLTVTEPEPGR